MDFVCALCVCVRVCVCVCVCVCVTRAVQQTSARRIACLLGLLVSYFVVFFRSLFSRSGAVAELVRQHRMPDLVVSQARVFVLRCVDHGRGPYLREPWVWSRGLKKRDHLAQGFTAHGDVNPRMSIEPAGGHRANLSAIFIKALR